MCVIASCTAFQSPVRSAVRLPGQHVVVQVLVLRAIEVILGAWGQLLRGLATDRAPDPAALLGAELGASAACQACSAASSNFFASRTSASVTSSLVRGRSAVSFSSR